MTEKLFSGKELEIHMADGGVLRLFRCHTELIEGTTFVVGLPMCEVLGSTAILVALDKISWVRVTDTK